MQRFPDLDDALQDLSEAINRRLLLVDQDMRAVAYSIHETPQDRERLSHALAHSPTWPRPQTAREVSSVENLRGIGPTLFVRVLDSNRFIIGHLVVALNHTEKSARQLNPALKRTVDDAVPQLGSLMETWRQKTANDSLHVQQLTIDLATGGPRRRKDAGAALIAERRLSASDSYCAVAMGTAWRTEDRDYPKAQRAVTRTLQFVRETSTATVVGGTLDNGVGILIFPRPVVAPRLARILQDTPLAGVRAGIGSLTSLDAVHRSFELASLALRTSCLAPEDYPIVTASNELGLDGVLARLPLEIFTVDDLPPLLRRLLERVESPSIIETLEAYLTAGGDAKETARRLNIHRSTLYYRLEKIADAVPGSLRDGDVRRELHVGLRIAKLAGLL